MINDNKYTIRKDIEDAHRQQRKKIKKSVNNGIHIGRIYKTTSKKKKDRAFMKGIPLAGPQKVSFDSLKYISANILQPIPRPGRIGP